MGWTNINFREAEFVANDTPIEVWMFEVSRQINSDAGIDPWLGELRDDWRLQATSGFGFGPSPDLDKYLTTDDRREHLLGYFRKALTVLSQRNSIISPDELSHSEIGGKDVIYTQGLPTQMVIDVGEQFVALIS